MGQKDYVNSGYLEVKAFKIETYPTFYDYLVGGCELALSVAIVFTASNGAPHDPRSLHYGDPTRPNDYVQAIHAAGSVLAPYDSNNSFPAVRTRMPHVP